MAQGRAREALRVGRGPLRSPGRPPVNRRKEHQLFWRRIAEGLSSEQAAVACGVSMPLGPRWFRDGGGMPPVSLDPPSGRYLSFAEREEIAVLTAQKHGVREIARQLGRNPSTISRERRRNAATRGARLDYRASVAQWHADRQARRPKTAKLAANEALQQYVQDRLAGTVTAPDGSELPPVVRGVWCAPGLAESGFWTSCHGEPSTFVLDRREHVGAAQGLVDTWRVRLRPHLEGCHRAQALPSGVS